MKKTFGMILTVLILCVALSFSVVAAPCFTVLRVSRGEGTVDVVCFLAQPQSGQELTCTVQDPQGDLLQVVQGGAMVGTNTLSLEVPGSGEVLTQLGGDGIVTPRKISVLDEAA